MTYHMDLMSYRDRVVLALDVPHACPICGVMSYLWVQRMKPDCLTASCIGCDPAEGGTHEHERL